MTAAMRAEVVRRLARRLAPGARCAVERPASRAGPAPPGMGRWVVIEYGGRAGYVLCVGSGMLITADEAEERNLEQIAVVPGRSVDAAALTARPLAEWLRLASPDHAADAAVGELRRAADAASRRALRRDGREDAEARAFARRCIEAGCWAGDDLAERAGAGAAADRVAERAEVLLAAMAPPEWFEAVVPVWETAGWLSWAPEARGADAMPEAMARLGVRSAPFARDAGGRAADIRAQALVGAIGERAMSTGGSPEAFRRAAFEALLGESAPWRRSQADLARAAISAVDPRRNATDAETRAAWDVWQAGTRERTQATGRLPRVALAEMGRASRAGAFVVLSLGARASLYRDGTARLLRGMLGDGTRSGRPGVGSLGAVAWEVVSADQRDTSAPFTPFRDAAAVLAALEGELLQMAEWCEHCNKRRDTCVHRRDAEQAPGAGRWSR